MIAPNPVTPEADQPPMTMAVLLRRCSDDAAFAMRLLQMFEKQLPTLLSAIEFAAIGGDGSGTARAAHALRGVAATMAADPLSDICHQIEVASEELARDLLPALRSEVRRCAEFTQQAKRSLTDAVNG